MRTLLASLPMLVSITVHAQTGNPNLADPGSGCSADSASSNAAQAYKIITGNTEEGWSTAGETAGAWVTLKFSKPVTVSEVWILPRPIFSYNITPSNLRPKYTYAPPRNVTIAFSDGTTMNVGLRQAEGSQAGGFEIVRLPSGKQTGFLKVRVDDVWEAAGSGGTGIGKVRVYAKPNAPSFTIRSMENYNGFGTRPAKLAVLSVVNPGEELKDVRVRISQNRATLDDIAVGTVPAHAVTEERIWTWVPASDGEYDVELSADGKSVAAPVKLPMTAFRKSYFDGGRFLIHSTNHNDLGWLGTQFETADYRSKEIILPALKIMETSPDYCYTMEAVAYLQEFLARHPERKDEIFKLTREGRFSWGASYTLMLQSQVGPEKLARQFYFGRRWLKENVPGADTRIYINADVPQLTWQLPQILKSAGIKYLSQARIPLGFYHWQGLDGTIIPVYGLRYGNSPKISPRANDEWLKLAYGMEEYYRAHNLPRIMIYDYNEDYLPPNAEYIPFVRNQNAEMRSFAAAWNSRHAGQIDLQIKPPVLSFTNPERMLDEIFNAPDIRLETVRGEWPNQWAYYDEPGNRKALLEGRRAHNMLLAAEKLFSLVKLNDPKSAYPRALFDTAWSANCWPDHGWGGGKGVITDSIYHASYRKAYEGARSLMDQALKVLDDHLSGNPGTPAGGHAKNLPLVVYNSLNWDRHECVTAVVGLPKEWKGFVVKDGRGAEVPFELVARTPDSTTILFNADVPASGIATYRIEPSSATPPGTREMSGDSIETPEFKIVFGNAGIREFTDRMKKRSYFRTEKFQAGELLEFAAPGNAWDDEAVLKPSIVDFDRSGNHASRTTRFVETPVRYIRETETPLKNCLLRQRYIVSKRTKDMELETELVGWNGARNKELRIAFPMNIEHRVTGGLSTVPASCLQTPDGRSSGLLGEYFDNPDLTGKPVLTRVDENMAPYWDKGSPAAGMPADFFSVRWTGTISAPETGDYVLGLITDDKGRVYFEDSLVVDNWNPYELNVMKTFRTKMEKGRQYRIRIEYAEVVEYAGMRFQWKRDESAADARVSASISYEIPFGAVDYNKDEVDFSRFPDNKESQFNPVMYGAIDRLRFREAVNWVNVSTGTYQGYGCLFASDMTVHLFEDQTTDPVRYPVVQHVLLSTRKSLAWDPEYWFEQKGDHKFRMALLFHDGNWRQRFREGVAFNSPLTAFVAKGALRSAGEEGRSGVRGAGGDARHAGSGVIPLNGSLMQTGPSNIIVTSVKESEDGRGTVIRFYEAEGDQCTARFRFAKPVKEAFHTDLLEYETGNLPVEPDGSLAVPVRPWEIVTMLIRH